MPRPAARREIIATASKEKLYVYESMYLHNVVFLIDLRVLLTFKDTVLRSGRWSYNFRETLIPHISNFAHIMIKRS